MKNRAREVITGLKIKQADIARSLDMSTVGLTQILNTPMPKIETMEKIAKTIGVPVWQLCLTDEEIQEIRNMDYPDKETGFNCPNCGARLKVSLMKEEQDNQEE